MSFEPPELLAGLGVPQPGRPVKRACQDLPAVRTKGYGPDQLRMSFEPPELPAGLGVPQPGRLVQRACQDLPAVRTKGYGIDHSSVCPSNRRSCRPVWASHSRAVSSKEPVRTCRPSGLKATELTEPVCPSNRRSCRPVWASHSRAVPSQEPVRTCRPSGLKATEDRAPYVLRTAGAPGRFGRPTAGPSRPRACQDLPAVRTKGYGIDRVRMSFEPPELPAGLGVPQPGRLVPEPVRTCRPSGLKATERTEPYVLRTAGAAGRFGRPTAGPSRPRACQDLPAVRTKGYGTDPARMSFEPPELLAGLGVPQPGRPVPRACQDLPAVRTKGYGKDPVRMSFEPPELRPVWASHSRAVLSSEPVRTCRPSGLKATERTGRYVLRTAGAAGRFGRPTAGPSRQKSLSGPAGRPD
jgi:hypothetical protein